MVSNVCKVQCTLWFFSISTIITGMLVMIAHVREKRHVLIFCAYVRGFFESVLYKVCVRRGLGLLFRMVWNATVNIMMSLKVM